MSEWVCALVELHSSSRKEDGGDYMLRNNEHEDSCCMPDC